MLLWSANGALCATETSLASDTTLSTEGYFVLSWTLDSRDPAQEFELQQSATTGFSQALAFSIPPAGDLTLTGFSDGSYFFRAGHTGNWSDTIEIVVQHHALGRAMAFFMLGLVLFVILVVVILRGYRLQGGQQD